MAATLTGIVFNDLNHNGQHNVGEPGIPNVYVVLFNQATSTCTSTTTDVNGNYSFSIATAGSYTVYEPVANPGVTCPPTTFTQPAGFTVSNGPRKLTTTVTAAQVNNGATISGQNFSHDTNANPLDCSLAMIQFAQQPTQWYNIDIVTGSSIIQGTLTPADNVNAIGYNILDNYIYGNDQTTNSIVRVDNSGNIMRLFPNPPGLPVQDYNTGTFDVSGFFYIYQFNDSRYYTIDLRPNSATFMKLVDPRNGYVEQTSNYGTPISTDLAIADWVFNTSDGFLYSLLATGQMRRINPTTGTVTNIATSPLFTGSFGAMAIDGTNTIYAISNNDGKVYRYTVSGNTATGAAFSNSVMTTANDGTMCPNAIIGVDFGDAPDTGSGTGPDNYNTLLSSNGPRHAQRTGLTLGTQITTELDAYQNPTATGDDISKGIQDDGLTVPLATLDLSATTYSLDVTVTNETGESANLYGWVDFSQNGLFQGNEAAPVVVVPSAVGTQVVTLNFTKPIGVTLTAGHTFVRLRLTTDTLTNSNGPTLEDTRSIGPASDGEVEDYILTIAPSADLSITKITSPDPVPAGAQIQYTIQVTNNGPDSAQAVSLEDTIPPEILNPEYSLDGGVTYSPWIGSISLGTMANGAISTVLIRGMVSATATGTTTNTATVSSTTEDPDPNNNTSTSTVSISQSADVAVVKTLNTNPIIAGRPIEYTIVVSNLGPSTAQNVVLADPLPVSITNPQFSIDGGITFNPWVSPYMIGALANGDSQSIIISGAIDPSATGNLTNTATVSSPTPDPNPANNTSTVTAPIIESADVSVVKTQSPNPLIPGQIATYTLVVANSGPSNALNVSLEDILPADISGAVFSVDGGMASPWVSPYNIGTLVSGDTTTIVISGLLSASAGTVTNTATVSSVTPDPNPANNTSTVVSPENAAADMAIVKTASPNPVIAGNQITYTLAVSNLGPSDAQNVTVTDTIPGIINNPQYSIDGGVTFNPWTGSLVIGTVIHATTTNILIRGIVDSSATGSLVNTATVDSTTPDPNPNNNTSTSNTPINTSADIEVIKTASPSPVIAGQDIIYSIDITNNGPSDAQSVSLTDIVPSSITGAEFSVDGGLTFNPWVTPYNLGTLASGFGQNIIIRGIVNSATTGSSLVNTATASSPTPDPDPNNNSSTVNTPVSTLADLSIVKVASPSPVLAGEQITYTITIDNAGPSDAQNVALTDAIPASVIGAQFSVDGGVTFNPWVSPYIIGTVVNGDTLEIIIQGTVVSGATESITNTAIINSTTPDPNPNDNTSTVVTPVNTLADLSIIKTASPSPVIAGNQITYTLNISNLGPSDAQTVSVADTLPLGVINAMFSVDGGITFNPWVSPYVIGTLLNGVSETIIIRGTVASDATDTLNNTATITSLTPDPDPDNNTSSTSTPVNELADISVIKTASPNPAVAGEQVTYTIVTTNSGPSDAQNVVVTDVVPSVLLNPQYSTDSGVTFLPWEGSYVIGTLAVAASVTTLIRGTISSSAKTGDAKNTVVVSSTTPDPDPTNNRSTTDPNVTTSADVAIVKSANPNPVTAGELLTYTIVVTNSGPSDAQNVVLKDAISSSLTGVQYSTDGGVTWNNWTGSYTIGTVSADTTNTILIRGTTQSTTTTTINNTASITSTTPDPDPNNNTSSIETLVNAVQITKASNVSNAVIGDTITYTIQVTNKGQVTAENFIVTDPLTPDLAYADNLKLNGNPILGDITQGVNIGNVLKGQTATLTFDATVLSIPNTLDRTIVNQTTGSYLYRANPAEPPIQGTATSNMNKVKVYNPSIQVTKIASAPSVIVGTPFVYTITVTNTGDITQNHVTVTDPLPAGFNVQSISLGGMAITGDLSAGINIGTLAPEQSKVLEVTIIVDDTVAINHFNNVATARGEVTVDPNRPILIVTGIGTDERGIDIYNPKLVLTKRADRTDAVVGSTVTYTITATNEGNVILNNVGLDNVLITDILSSELEFIPGSVTIDNLAAPNANILAGINLGSIAINQTRIITFKAIVLSSEITPITNQALADFTYTLPGLPVQVGHAESNVVELNVFKAELVVTKTVDKQEASVGDILTYTVTLKNTGDITVYKVLFTDVISPQSTLIPGSFRLNGKVVNSVDLSKGIVIGSIAPGQSVIITYQVRVTGSNCSGTIVNDAAATFEYRLPDGSSGTLTANNEAGSTVVFINISTFKQMSIESYLPLVEAKPNIEAINTITGTIDICSHHVIITTQGMSREGQMLTGYKLVIKGALNIVTEYTALDIVQSVHSASYQIPFSTFIVLPPDYVGGSKLEVTGTVEDIYYQVVDIRTFFVNALALINVKVMSC